MKLSKHFICTTVIGKFAMKMFPVYFLFIFIFHWLIYLIQTHSYTSYIRRIGLRNGQHAFQYREMLSKRCDISKTH